MVLRATSGTWGHLGLLGPPMVLRATYGTWGHLCYSGHVGLLGQPMLHGPPMVLATEGQNQLRGWLSGNRFKINLKYMCKIVCINGFFQGV